MKTKHAVWIAFFLNLSYAIVEFIAGGIFGSSAVLADSVHDLGDAIAIGISAFLESISNREEDSHYTLGYKRFSLLGAMVTAVILMTGSVLVILENITKLFHHLFERAEHLSPQDYLAHIFQHFKKNQDHVTSLLLSKNDYFIRQLRKELEHDVYPMVADELIQSYPNIPHSYLKHLVVSHFIETLSWWLKKGKSYTEQEVIEFYLEILKVSSN